MTIAQSLLMYSPAGFAARFVFCVVAEFWLRTYPLALLLLIAFLGGQGAEPEGVRVAVSRTLKYSWAGLHRPRFPLHGVAATMLLMVAFVGFHMYLALAIGEQMRAPAFLEDSLFLCFPC